jgi:hypothetical protein
MADAQHIANNPNTPLLMLNMLVLRGISPQYQEIINTEIVNHELVLTDTTTWYDRIDPKKTAQAIAQRIAHLGPEAGLPVLTLKENKLIEGALLLWYFSYLPSTDASHKTVSANISASNYINLVLASQNEAEEARIKTKNKTVTKTLTNLSEEHSYSGNSSDFYKFNDAVNDHLAQQGFLHVLEQGLPEKHNPNKVVTPEENASAKTFLKNACAKGSKATEMEDAQKDFSITFYAAYISLSTFASQKHSAEREIAITEAEEEWNNQHPIPGESVNDMKKRFKHQENTFKSLQFPKTATAKLTLLNKLISETAMFENIHTSIVMDPSKHNVDEVFDSMLKLETYETKQQANNEKMNSKIREMVASNNPMVQQLINAEAIRINEFKKGDKGKRTYDNKDKGDANKRRAKTDLPEGVTQQQLTAHLAKFSYPAPWWGNSFKQGLQVLALPKATQNKLSTLILSFTSKGAKIPNGKSYMSATLSAWRDAINGEKPPSYAA